MNHAWSSVAASLAIALGLGCAGRAQPPEGAPDMPPDLELMSGYPAGSDPVYALLQAALQALLHALLPAPVLAEFETDR